MKNYFLYPALVLALMFTACNDGDNFQGPPDDNDDPKTTSEYLRSHLEDMLQEFTFDNNGDEAVTLKTKGGIKFTIHPGTFTKDGTAVDGKVDIKVYEMLTMSSIVFSGTNTNYVGNQYQGPGYFESDGFFHLSATVNGAPVDEDLATWMNVAVPVRDKEQERRWTMIWPGTEEAGPNEDQFAWVDPNQDWGQWEAGWNEDFEFVFDLGKLGWCNCDVFSEGKYTLKIKLTGDFGKFANYLAAEGETYVFFAAKGAPILAHLYTLVNDSTVESYKNAMPEGPGRLFVFSIKDGVYTYAEQEITINGDMEVTLDMEEKDKEYIDKRISTLDNYK